MENLSALHPLSLYRGRVQYEQRGRSRRQVYGQ